MVEHLPPSFGRLASTTGVFATKQSSGSSGTTPPRAHRRASEASASLSPTSVKPQCRGPGQLCAHCEERRMRVTKLSREVDALRKHIINDIIVTMEPPPDADVSDEVHELIAESVKLRITLDALCRFQQFANAE